ncbi:hypothetical protein C2W62_53770, partial [Candidatus Entotheonella serta]
HGRQPPSIAKRYVTAGTQPEHDGAEEESETQRRIAHETNSGPFPNGLRRFTVPVEADELTRVARTFRRLVQSRTTRRYLPHAW